MFGAGRTVAARDPLSLQRAECQLTAVLQLKGKEKAGQQSPVPFLMFVFLMGKQVSFFSKLIYLPLHKLSPEKYHHP